MGQGLGALLRIREFAIAAAIVVLGAILSFLTPYFLTGGNLTALVIGLVTSTLVTIGQVIVLVAGGLDLSVGAVMAASGTIVGLLMLEGLSPWLATGLTLLFGAFVGLVNGLIVTRAGVSPLIATLGMMTIVRGVGLVFTEGFSVTGLDPAFAYWGQGRLLGLPPMVWVTLVLLLAFDLALRLTRSFRQIYYVGGNERAARLSGIPVDRVRVWTYVGSGALSALSGIFLASRLMSGTPTAGTGLELTSIAAAVIGGASLMGGEGTVLGAFLGAFLLAMVSNASVILGVSIYWQGIVTGVILIVVVTADMVLRRREGRGWGVRRAGSREVAAREARREAAGEPAAGEVGSDGGAQPS
ncbi:MAG: ABC transporter permease [Clostridia bacterium]|nr:ABC transporter permease [Clostridia bacterium]